MKNETTKSPEPTTERIMRKKEVLNTTGLCNTTLYQEINAGRFPKPRKLGERAVGWLSSEVSGWITNLPVA